MISSTTWAVQLQTSSLLVDLVLFQDFEDCAWYTALRPTLELIIPRFGRGSLFVRILLCENTSPGGTACYRSHVWGIRYEWHSMSMF